VPRNALVAALGVLKYASKRNHDCTTAGVSTPSSPALHGLRDLSVLFNVAAYCDTTQIGFRNDLGNFRRVASVCRQADKYPTPLFCNYLTDFLRPDPTGAVAELSTFSHKEKIRRMQSNTLHC
jgi:hypothetical protein